MPLTAPAFLLFLVLTYLAGLAHGARRHPRGPSYWRSACPAPRPARPRRMPRPPRRTPPYRPAGAPRPRTERCAAFLLGALPIALALTLILGLAPPVH